MRFIGTLLAVLWAVGLNVASAGDWPQILGPDRNGIARDESLAGRWPKDGPDTVWQRPVGSGFSAISIAGGRAVLFHRKGREEIAEALDTKTGKTIWSQSFPATYVPSFTSDSGPRATPLIRDGRVYLYGAQAAIYCLDMSDGKVLWQRDAYEDYSSKRPSRGEPPEGYFGFGSSPILEGNRLLINIGGSTKEAGIVAFDATTGKTMWKATDERASYSSPVAATIGGQRHVIFATRLNVVSVDPADGRVLFRFPFGRLGPAATGACPVVLGDSVFVSASYGFGAVLARTGASGAIEVWSDDEIMSSQYTTCVRQGESLIGVHGRQDQGFPALRCFNPKTKQIAWTKEDFGYATLILADDKLVIMTTDGELVLAEANTKKYVELARTRLFNSTTRALPALSNGLLFVRDTATLKCVDLSDQNGG
jgi:outer membrane protein assembly factor BamB